MSERTHVEPPHGVARGGWWALAWRGAVVWLVPFVGTAPLVGHDGALRVPFGLFKSVAVGLLLAALMAVRRWPAPAWRLGVAATVYAAMSVALDLVVLVGALHMPPAQWSATVLPAYLMIPLVLLVRR